MTTIALDTPPDIDPDEIARYRRIADFGPEVRELFEEDIDGYNGGQPLGINEMAELFGVKVYTIYAWCPSDNAVQPSTEYLPAPDMAPDGHRAWFPRTAIDWGIAAGKLDWRGPRLRGWQRRDYRRLQSPGRARRTRADVLGLS